MSVMAPLKDRAVIITGAAQGLGAAYARATARAGARLVLNDVEETALAAVASEVRAMGTEVEAFLGSVAERDVAESMVSRCRTRFGAVDGLVNNAAVIVRGPAAETDLDEARRAVDVNLLGVVNVGVCALRAMQEQGRGSIVNVTSGAAIGLPERSVYGAAKGAVVSLTHGWAIDAQPHGIRINAISPLATTAMLDAERAGREWPADDIAPLVVHLLGDRADFTGQVVRLVRGSLSLVHPMRSGTEIEAPEQGWTVESISNAIDGPLSGELSRVGLARDVGPRMP